MLPFLSTIFSLSSSSLSLTFLYFLSYFLFFYHFLTFLFLFLFLLFFLPFPLFPPLHLTFHFLLVFFLFFFPCEINTVPPSAQVQCSPGCYLISIRSLCHVKVTSLKPFSPSSHLPFSFCKQILVMLLMPLSVYLRT